MRRLFALTTLPLAACAGAAGGPAAVGMANPASQYCLERGGRLEIRDEEGGQAGYCHLPDGRVVEEWALFRAEKGAAE